MKRSFPKVELPVISTDSAGDRELSKWCHEVLHSMEWCNNPLMPFVVQLIARRRYAEVNPFPAEIYDIPFLYEIFQDYTWTHMPERLKEVSHAKTTCWHAICHNYVSFRELLETYNACYHEAYKFAMYSKE